MAKTNPGRITTSFKVPGRNKFDLSHRFSFNAQFGEIYPVAHFPMTPATRLQLSPSAIVRSAALSHPLMTQARARLYAFWVPDRLYAPNILRNSEIDAVELPRISMSTKYIGDFVRSFDDRLNPFDISVSGVYNVVAGSLLQFIGFPAGFNFKQTSESSNEYISRQFNGSRLLGYYDIVRNYFANRNEQYVAIKCVASPQLAARHSYNTEDAVIAYFTENQGGGTLNKANRLYESLSGIYYEELEYIDQFYNNQYFVDGMLPISDLNGERDDLFLESKAGLALKSYMPDLLNSFVMTEQFEDAIARSIVRLSQANGVNTMSIQELIGSKKLYDFLVEKIATGGQMDQLMRTQFGVDITNELDIPMLLRTWSFDIDFNAVSGTAGDNLGELGGIGYGSMSGTTEKGKRKKDMILDFSSDQFGEVHIYMTIEPYCDYGLNVDPFLLKINLTDYFWPAFDRSGFQPILCSSVQAYYPTMPVQPGGNRFYDNDAVFQPEFNPFDNQIGMQPTYTEYMGKVNRVGGDFADINSQLNKWTFLRQIPLSWSQHSNGNPDWSTAVDASIYNGAFKDTTLASYPFYVTLGFNATAKMPISRNQLTTDL